MVIKNVLRGAVAGFLATAPMTAAMELMHHYLPWWQRYPLPPSQITQRFTQAIGVSRKTNKQEHQALTLLAHFGYGAAAGAIYGPLAARLRVSSVSGGITFGLLVWLVSYLGLLPAMRALPPATKHPLKRTLLMILAHVIYGAALGLLTRRLARQEQQADEDEPQVATQVAV